MFYVKLNLSQLLVGLRQIADLTRFCYDSHKEANMRIPETPPNWSEALTQEGGTRFLFAPGMEEYVRAANDKYLHWDKLRFRPTPEGVSVLQAWAAVVLSRNSHRSRLPLTFQSNHKLWYWIPPQHQEWIHEIDQNAGGFIGSQESRPHDDNERYLFNSLMEEAIASSQLEGANTTREVAKEMLRTNRKPRDRAEQMIVNNYNAILEIRELKREKLTPSILKHLQKVLTHDTLDKADAAGRFRNASEKVDVVDQFNETMYVPPDAASLQGRIEQICAFANEKSATFIHPVIKAIALHFAIGLVHPFVDGNGRTARAVFYWFMLKSDYWLFEYLPISRIIQASATRYSRAYLHVEHDGGDLTYFLHYHLKVIHRAIKELHEYLSKQKALLREAEELVTSYPELNLRQKLLVQHALRHPKASYTVQLHAGEYRVTYNTARSDLTGLVQTGLFDSRKRGKKEIVFFPHQELRKRLQSLHYSEKKPSTRGKTRRRKSKDGPSLFE